MGCLSTSCWVSLPGNHTARRRRVSDSLLRCWWAWEIQPYPVPTQDLWELESSLNLGYNKLPFSDHVCSPEKKSPLLHVHLDRKALLVSTKIPCAQTATVFSPLAVFEVGVWVDCPTYPQIYHLRSHFLHWSYTFESQCRDWGKDKVSATILTKIGGLTKSRKSLATTVVFGHASALLWKGEGWTRVPGNG